MLVMCDNSSHIVFRNIKKHDELSYLRGVNDSFSLMVLHIFHLWKHQTKNYIFVIPCLCILIKCNLLKLITQLRRIKKIIKLDIRNSIICTVIFGGILFFTIDIEIHWTLLN